MYEQQPYNPFRNNIAIIKDYFKSPMILALAIANILSVTVSMVYSIMSASYAAEILRQIAAFLEKNLVLQDVDGNTGNQAVKQISESLSSSTVTFSIPIFSVLAIVALLLLYFGSRNTNPDSAPTAGVTILNILAILSLVGCILLTVVLLILAVALFIVYAAFRSESINAFSFKLNGSTIKFDAEVILIVAIAFTVFAVICSFIMLFYAISRKRYIGSIKKSLTSVELSRAGARPFGVFCVITAVFSSLGLISSVFNLFAANYSQEVLGKIGLELPKGTVAMTALSIAIRTVAVVIAVLQAKIALGYAKYIDEKSSGINTPSEAGGGFAPINAGVGVSPQPAPYSYPAAPQAGAPVKDDSFVNPYAATDETIAVAPVTCPSCGAKVDANAPFCGNCGKKL